MSRRIRPDALVVILPDSLVTGRLADGNAGFARLARAGDEALGTSLAAAVATLPRRSAVMVLDGDVWSQTLELPLAQVQGVGDDSLAILLGREAETYSGVSASRSTTLWRRLGAAHSMARHLVAQVAGSDLAEIAAAFKKQGCRLVGVSHPAFLAHEEEVDAFLLRASEAPEAFFAAWRAAVASDAERPVPFVAPPPEPVPAGRYAMFALLLALAAALACAFLESVRAGARAERLRTLGELEQCRARWQATRQRAAADFEAAERLRRKLESDVNAPLRHIRARRSFARILDAFASNCPPGGMVKSISSEGDWTLAVEGVTATSDDAETFLKGLGTSLRPGGFAVATLSLESLNQLPGGGPWSFKCRIQPVPGEVMP